MKSPLLAYYGDDFTGSTDALEFLARAGVPAVLFTGTPTAECLARFPEARAIGVAGCTRALAPAQMEQELRPALAALRGLGVPHVHYKVCSTFDSSPAVGSIGRAIEIGAEIFDGRFVPLVVGAPALGRYCVFGNLFARFGIGSSGAIHRLDRHPSMSRHPVTPADESDLRLHLERQTRLPIGLVDVLALARSELQCRAVLDQQLGEGARIVLFDALESAHLERIGALLGPLGTFERPLFSVGSSAIEMAFGAYWQKLGTVQPTTAWPNPGAAPLLVVSGSCSPVTFGQIAWAVANGFAEVPIDPAASGADVERIARTAVDLIGTGRNVVVHTRSERASAGPLGAVSAETLGTVLGQVAREVIEVTPVRRLVVAGGDTSSYAARALGIEAVEMIAPLAPGAPLCRAYAPGSAADGIEVNFKGGQVGAPDYFGAVARGTM